MLYDLVPIVGVLGMVIIGVTAFITNAIIKKSKQETINTETANELRAELTEIKTSLASIEKMMKDID